MSACVKSGCANDRPESQFLCHNCVNRLRNQLGDIPALWHELETTMTRQDAIGTDGGRKSAETALAFKPNASEARWVLRDTIRSWARLLAEHAGLSTCITRPATWLLANVQSIAMHPAADEAADEIGEAVRNAYRAVDRGPDLVLAGTCTDCEALLYARPDDVNTRCECGLEYDVSVLRAAMLDNAGYHLVTGTVALGWVKMLMGKTIPDGTWRSWVSRGRILAHGLTIEGKPTYRFGEVRDLALDYVSRRAA